MLQLFGLLAPATLLLSPVVATSDKPPAAKPVSTTVASAPALGVPTGEPPATAAPPGWLEALGLERQPDGPVLRQVRIEGRVVIRVVPRGRRARQDMAAAADAAPNRNPSPSRMAERKIGKCIPMRGIAGVQASEGNRLLFFMRDQRLVSARLEKACRAEAFYSGFYIEPSRDGQLCIDRDLLRSRSGVKCEVDRLRQLVKVDT